MADKYLSAGTATWTAATRTISAATMTPVFESGDATARRQVFFRIGASLYRGRTETFVSATSITLVNWGVLPSTNGTIDDIILFDLSENHTYLNHFQQVEMYIDDAAVKLSHTGTNNDIDRIIANAVSDYSIHRPHYIKKKIQGDGTAQYLLSTKFGSSFVVDSSSIKSVEFPFDDDPPTYLDAEDYGIYDDGTAQDGTNLKFRFLAGDAPAATDYFIVEYSTPRSLPSSGVANYPVTTESFQAICLRAAMYGCLALAAGYAQSIDANIGADVVNYAEKTRKYLDLAKQYNRQYNMLVFGAESPSTDIQGAFLDKDVDLQTMDGKNFVFHSLKNR